MKKKSPQFQAEIISLDAFGNIRGYAFYKAKPAEILHISVVAGNFTLGQFECLQARDLLDLNDSEIPINCGFIGNVPIIELPQDNDDFLAICDLESGGRVITKFQMNSLMSTQALIRSQMRTECHIDSVTSDGEINGWAWNPIQPDNKLVLDVLVDSEFFARISACIFRPDLSNAGIGDGHYGFRYYMPSSLTSNREPTLVQIRDAFSSIIVAEKKLGRSSQSNDLFNRLHSLEREITMFKIKSKRQA